MLRADTTAYVELRRRLNDVGDKRLTNAVRKAIRDAAKPMGAAIVRDAAAGLPSRGGLRARVESARVGLTQSADRVRLQFADRNGMFLGQFEAGSIRHPLFGMRRHWFGQNVPGGRFAQAFARHGEAALRSVEQEVTAALEGIK